MYGLGKQIYTGQCTLYTPVYTAVSGFECTFPLFLTRKYKVVSPSTYATKIRTYGQLSSAVCFDQHSDEKPKVEMKTKSNCAPDGSVMLVNGFSE